MVETRTLIIGVGNADRCDDGAGLVVASRLRSRLNLGHAIRVIEHWGEASGLVDVMEGWDQVLIIDASVSGAAPGSYRVFEAGKEALPAQLAETSSHGFGVAQAIELARVLGTLPTRCRVYAIEGQCFETGAPMSEAINAAIDKVAEDIMRWLEIARIESNDEMDVDDIVDEAHLVPHR